METTNKTEIVARKNEEEKQKLREIENTNKTNKKHPRVRNTNPAIDQPKEFPGAGCPK